MEKEKPLKLMLTFKKDEKYIYDEIQRHSGKGNWVKDILKEHIKRLDGKSLDDLPKKENKKILGE